MGVHILRAVVMGALDEELEVKRVPTRKEKDQKIEARREGGAGEGSGKGARPIPGPPPPDAIPSLAFDEAPRLNIAVEAKVDVAQEVVAKIAVPALLPAQMPRLSIECESGVKVGMAEGTGVRLVTFTLERPPQVSLRVSSSVEHPVRPVVVAVPYLSPLSMPPLNITVDAAVKTGPGPFSEVSEGVKGETEVAGADSGEERLLKEVEGFLKEITFGLAGGVSKGGPVVLILPKPQDDRFVFSLALLCRELYRVVAGGNPEPYWVSSGSKEEVERELRAGRRLFVVDDEKCELLSPLRKARDLAGVNWSALRDRLSELFSQDFGFIIFHVRGDLAEAFAKRLEAELGPRLPGARIVEVPTLDAESRVKLAALCWGVSHLGLRGGSYDEAFGEAKKRFYEVLGIIWDENLRLRLMMRFQEGEGDEHRRLKLLVTRVLARELGAKGEEEIPKVVSKGVDTECGLEWAWADARADVCARRPDGRVVYAEIETFYGVGDPVEKLKRTLDRYVGGPRDCEVRIVVQPLHALLFARELLEVKKHYRREHKLNVEVYTVNVEEEELVPLSEVLEQLKSVCSRRSA